MVIVKCNASFFIVETSSRETLFIRLQFYPGTAYKSKIDFSSVMGKQQPASF